MNDYHCRTCGWHRTILNGETIEDAKRAHEGADVHALYTPTTCDACGGNLSDEPERVVCETDSQLADHEYLEGPYFNGTCDIDGWKKFEHDLGRDVVVHGSCFLDNDDVLVRI